MKTIILLASLLFLSTSCEYATIKYGFYWNPVYVLLQANEGVKNNDVGQFSEVLSGKTLCVYGTQEGMANVRSALNKVSNSSLEEPVLISSRYLKEPHYTGYFSYYQETYEARGLTAQGKLALKITILCNYGNTDENPKYVNASMFSYSTRSCSIVGIKNIANPIKEADYCQN